MTTEQTISLDCDNQLYILHINGHAIAGHAGYQTGATTSVEYMFRYIIIYLLLLIPRYKHIFDSQTQLCYVDQQGVTVQVPGHWSNASTVLLRNCGGDELTPV